MKKIIKSLAMLWVAGLLAAPALATEGGSDSAALGAEGLSAGALPPPGVYLLTYYQNYRADKIVDSHGHSAAPKFDLTANAIVPRLVLMTEKQLLGGQLGFYAAQPIVGLDVNVAGMSDSKTGMGDLILAGLLAWHNNNHHWAAAIETVSPTGSYRTPSQERPVIANTGKNYYTVRPILAYSYINPKGFELSTKMSYSVNGKNDDTNYQSGDYLAADYSLGYQLTPQWTAAIQGYALKQISDDKVNGKEIIIGDKSLRSALPFVIKVAKTGQLKPNI